MLRHAFASKAPGATVETELLEGIARMSLRHPAARAILAHGENMARLVQDWGEATIAGPRYRYGGFVADRIAGRFGRPDCCGQGGEVGYVCSMCSVAVCNQCLRGDGREHRAWRAGVTSPECACMWGGPKGGREMVPLARGATCMVIGESNAGSTGDNAMLWPVWNWGKLLR